MKLGWLQWLGLVAAAFLGASIFSIGARITRDTSLLVNSDVIGSAIGASLTILGTLAIDAWRRKSEKRLKLQQLRRTINAMLELADMGLQPADMCLTFEDRTSKTATILGALAGGLETMHYAMGRADIDVGLWLKLETLDRKFEQFEEWRAAELDALTHPSVTEQEWTSACSRLATFCAEVRPRLTGAIEVIDAQA
jgi:uncharacterized protein YjiS (DUF1127 family)